jgi:hypothetical protein
MTLFHEHVVAPFMVFSIPIVAIVGGIIASVVKTLSHHRLMESALRERMALVARGVDPARLGAEGDLGAPLLAYVDYARFRAQGLLIGGMVTLAAGLSFGAFVGLVDSWDSDGWLLAVVPVTIGLALIASAAVVWPRGGKADPRALPRTG